MVGGALWLVWRQWKRGGALRPARENPKRDPEVLKAVTLLPQAQALEAKAQQVLRARIAANQVH